MCRGWSTRDNLYRIRCRLHRKKRDRPMNMEVNIALEARELMHGEWSETSTREHEIVAINSLMMMMMTMITIMAL